MRPVLYSLYAAAAAVAFLIVGTMDHSAEQDAADRYAQMVCEGHWPDYDQRDPACEQFTHHSNHKEDNR